MEFKVVFSWILLAHMPTLATAIFHYYSPFVRRVSVVGLLGATVSLGLSLWLATSDPHPVAWSTSDWLQPLALRANWIYWAGINLFLMIYLLSFIRNRTPAPYPVKRVCFLTGLVVAVILISGAVNIFSLFLGSVLLSVCYSFFLGNVGDFDEYQAIGVVTWRNGCADILGLFALSETIPWGISVYVFAKTLALCPLGIWKKPAFSVWTLYILMLVALAFPTIYLDVSPAIFLGGTLSGLALGWFRANELMGLVRVATVLGSTLGKAEKFLQWLLYSPVRALKAGWVVTTFVEEASLKASLLVSLVLISFLMVMFS